MLAQQKEQKAMSSQTDLADSKRQIASRWRNPGADW